MEPNSYMVLISREGKVITFLPRGKCTIIHNEILKIQIHSFLERDVGNF